MQLLTTSLILSESITQGSKELFNTRLKKSIPTPNENNFMHCFCNSAQNGFMNKKFLPQHEISLFFAQKCFKIDRIYL